VNSQLQPGNRQQGTHLDQPGERIMQRPGRKFVDKTWHGIHNLAELPVIGDAPPAGPNSAAFLFFDQDAAGHVNAPIEGVIPGAQYVDSRFFPESSQAGKDVP
jgi:hypothetical protein